MCTIYFIDIVSYDGGMNLLAPLDGGHEEMSETQEGEGEGEGEAHPQDGMGIWGQSLLCDF